MKQKGILLILILIMASVWLLIWLRTDTLKLKYELGQYQRVKERLLDEQQKLLLKKEELSALWKVERLAKKKLGLTETQRHKVFYVRVHEEPRPFITGYRDR